MLRLRTQQVPQELCHLQAAFLLFMPRAPSKVRAGARSSLPMRRQKNWVVHDMLEPAVLQMLLQAS